VEWSRFGMKLEPTSSHHYQIYEALYSDTGCEKMGENNKNGWS
jgi:hypothetical protein